MAIKVYKFPQPYLELSLEEGGELPVADYYFLGWFQRHAGYYHPAHGECSEEQHISTTEGNQKIKVTWWKAHGAITAFSDAGGGDVYVTSVNHGRSSSDSVKIIGTTNYDGEYVIQNVFTSNVFSITHSWDGNDATGRALFESGIPEEVTESYTGTSGICFKWDNTSMVMPVAGTPYKWLNNYPNESQDYSSTYGHRKWCQAYSAVNYRSGSSNTFTEIGTGTSGLKDGVVHGASYSSRGSGHLQVAYRDYSGGSQVGILTSATTKLHIKIDNNDTNNNWDDLVTALIASGYTENYALDYRDGHVNTIYLMGNYDGAGEGTWTNITLVSSGGWRCANITYDNCQIKWLSCQVQNRTSGDHCIDGTYKNTNFLYNGTSMDIYNYVTADGFAPYGTMTFYENCIGYTFNVGIGGYVAGNTYFQFRYPNAATPHTMTDVTTNGLLVLVTYTAGYPEKRIVVERVNMNNNGIRSYDFSISYSYMDNKECVFNWDLKDVASNRDNGQIIVYFTSLSDPTSYEDIWYSRYDINLTIVDQDNNPISGASVSLVGDETSEDTSDVNGEATVTILGYTITAPQGGGNQYGTNSDWKTGTLTISADGYVDFVIEDLEIREGQDWTISMSEVLPIVYNASQLEVSIEQPNIEVQVNEPSVSVSVNEPSVSVSVNEPSVTVSVNEPNITIS